jgi:aarF domain-containing kinase
MSTPLPLCLKSKEKITYQKEAEKEIIVSTPPDILKKDPKDDLSIVDSYNYNGSADHIVGSLPSHDWELVEKSGATDFLDSLSEVHSGWRGFRQKMSLFYRACWLAAIFIPFMILAFPLYFISTLLSAYWKEYLQCTVWVMLRYCLERGGAAFIKWGQWSSTREDLFPDSLCRILGRLHDQAPTHSYKQTRRAILKHFKRPIEAIFDDFPLKPFASGSIAQVYRARLKGRGDDTPLNVAVKVRHPAVALRIYQDFQIMSFVADIVQGLPALRWLNLRQSIDQFSHTMTSQADLRVEAINLQRFYNNFQGLHQTVVWPKLIPDLVSEGVIVETFERGAALHEFLRKRSSLNTQIAAVGVDAYLKMILTDNFVHTDLHPGNILARMAENDKGECIEQLQLVLLDFGLAEELPPRVRYHFLSFIMNIGAADGERAAHHLLHFSWPNPQRCPRPELLVADMKILFDQECDLRVRSIDLNSVLKQVLQLCRKHEVTIDSSYASLVVAVCVLVGFARSLDPELSIMDAAVPCLFLYNLVGRIPGGIYG